MPDLGVDYAVELQRSFDDLTSLLNLLSQEEIERADLGPGWTPKTLVAHVAFWDDYQTRRMQAAVEGSSAANGFPSPAEDNDARLRLDQHRVWSDIQAEAQTARARMIEFAVAQGDSTLEEGYPEGQRILVLERLLQHMVNHTQEHADELRAYIERR